MVKYEVQNEKMQQNVKYNIYTHLSYENVH